MRGIVFAVLTLIVGGLIALGLEWVAALLPAQLESVFVRIYTVGIRPLAAHINICGILGVVFGYIIISKFVKK